MDKLEQIAQQRREERVERRLARRARRKAWVSGRGNLEESYPFPWIAIEGDEIIKLESREEFEEYEPTTQDTSVVFCGKWHFECCATREQRRGLTWDQTLEQARELDMAAKRKAAKTAAKKSAAPKAATNGASKAASLRSKEVLGKKITIKTEEKKNPKREGTRAHKRFSMYKDGMTVEDYIKAGGKKSSVSYDVKKGYIALS